jgi:hypothetical protein
MRDGGVLSHLYAMISANTLNSDATLKTRKNAGAAAQTATITASTSGSFEDITNTDTVTAAEKWNYNYVGIAGTGSTTLDTFASLFAATTNTVTKSNCMVAGSYTVASTPSFLPVGGRQPASITTEANEKSRMRKAGTMTNLMANVITNSRAQASTVTGRLNGANGALTKSITGSTTGFFEDTVNSDTIAVGNDYGLSVVTGTGTGTLALRPYAVSFVSTASFGMVVGGTSASTTQLVNITRFYKYGSDNVASSTENNTVKIKARDAFTLSQLTIFVNTNTVTADSTLTSRKNAGAGSLTATITNATTGVFSDTTNTEVDVSTDLINTQLVTGATGTSLLFVELAVWTTVAAAGGVTARPRTNAINLSPYLTMNLGPQIGLGVGNQGGINL